MSELTARPLFRIWGAGVGFWKPVAAQVCVSDSIDTASFALC